MSDVRASALTGLTDAALAELDRLFAADGADPADAAIPRRGASRAPLSYAQELLWLLDRSSPGITAYNVPLARRIRGPLDMAALGRAVDLVVDRHEILRTTYAGETDGV